MDFTFDVSELKRINARLDLLAKKTQQTVVKKAIKAGGQILLDEARSRAPVFQGIDKRRQKGLLKRSIKMHVKGKGKHATATIAVQAAKSKKSSRGIKKKGTTSDPFYWYFVEFGTVNMKARPFLRPAYDSKKDKATQEVIKILKNEVMNK